MEGKNRDTTDALVIVTCSQLQASSRINSAVDYSCHLHSDIQLT